MFVVLLILCETEYFWDLHQYLKHRKDRRMALENYIQSSHMTENDKQKARREWFVKETALLRRRRVKVRCFALSFCGSRALTGASCS